MSLLRPWFSGSLLLAIALGSPAAGQEPAPDPLRPLRSSYLTNGAATRRAFAEVVADANRWTVRVLANDEEVAFGVIVRSDGYIITKGNRLQGRLECEMPGSRMLPAKYVGYHPGHDLALLKVDAADLPVVRWQDAADPAVGRWAVTPDGQGSPRAVGVISVSRRQVPKVRIRGVLGVRLDPESQQARVLEVLPDSAAEAAGLQAEDIITRVNEATVTSLGTLVAEIGKHSPQETLRLLVTRKGRKQVIPATLTHPFGDFLSRIDQQNAMGGRLSLRRTGFPVVLQHDSVLRPEECGGPLVDLSGAAVGINIARAGRTETYTIPDDIVRPLVADLLAGKYPPPPTKLAGARAQPTEQQTSTSPASGGE